MWKAAGGAIEARPVALRIPQAQLEELCSTHSEAQRDKEAKLQQKNEKIASLENEVHVQFACPVVLSLLSFFVVV